jgi:hypothetical protein
MNVFINLSNTTYKIVINSFLCCVRLVSKYIQYIQYRNVVRLVSTCYCGFQTSVVSTILKFTFAKFLKYCLSSQKLICTMKNRSRQKILHESFSAIVSVVGIATRCVLDGPKIESWCGRGFLHPSIRPCDQPSSIQWKPEHSRE